MLHTTQQVQRGLLQSTGHQVVLQGCQQSLLKPHPMPNSAGHARKQPQEAQTEKVQAHGGVTTLTLREADVDRAVEAGTWMDVLLVCPSACPGGTCTALDLE